MKFFLSLLALATLAFAANAYACGESAADQTHGLLSAGKTIKECAATKNYLNPNLIDRNAAADDDDTDTSSTVTKEEEQKKIEND